MILSNPHHELSLSSHLRGRTINRVPSLEHRRWSPLCRGAAKGVLLTERSSLEGLMLMQQFCAIGFECMNVAINMYKSTGTILLSIFFWASLCVSFLQLVHSLLCLLGYLRSLSSFLSTTLFFFSPVLPLLPASISLL